MRLVPAGEFIMGSTIEQTEAAKQMDRAGQALRSYSRLRDRDEAGDEHQAYPRGGDGVSKHHFPPCWSLSR
jgi:hypothetical protein